MSPEPVRLQRAPSGARIVEGGLEELVARTLAEREQSAFQKGDAEGEARARSAAARALDAAADRLDFAREEAATHLARTSVVLATEIARALLLVEVDAGRYDLERMVRDALAVADVGRAACVVCVNPKDAEALADTRFREGTELRPDAGVARGEVQVETPHGVLVRDVESAVERVRERLLEELRG